MKVIIDITKSFLNNDLDKRPGFKNWVKLVSSIDDTKENGFAFLGEFQPLEGLKSFEIGKIILSCQDYGSMKHHAPIYRVFQITPEGCNLMWEELNPPKVGWALLFKSKLQEHFEKCS